MKSEFGKLNARDFFRGLIVAGVTAAFGVIYGAVMAEDFSFTWLYWQPFVIASAKAGVQAFAGYLMLNLFSGPGPEKQ